jgi:predicted SAM-dependent methyltransferase
MPTRLQIGVSRLENINAEALQKFLDKTWIHLGDEKQKPTFSHIMDVFKQNNFFDICKMILYKAVEYIARNKKRQNHCQYQSTNFMPLFYKKDNYLPFKNNSFDYIFSEHFFEHLFLDEALSLFRECYRVLRWNGVVRTCVPDADLRPTPEPVGHPSIRMPYTHPDKHKTRWSVYSLTEIIRLAGFEPVPIRYYDKMKQCQEVSLPDLEEIYQSCADPEMALDFTHIQRKDSLIIDGIKRR